MPRLTQNFDRAEFACRCGCGFDTVDYELLTHLEYERAHFGRPIIITSGARCAEYNRRVGGAERSQHVLGRAADHYIEGVSPREQYEYFNSRFPRRYGLGLYVTSNFIHFDTRVGEAARWRGKGA